MRSLIRRAGVLVAATLSLAALCLVFSIPASAQQLAKRLILKDGSYQLASKYEVKGNRVRYLSAERGEWEEIPSALVDWAATEKFEKDRAAGAPAPEAVELDRELEAERLAEETRTPQVAPGLRLPGEGGVILLDTFSSQPQLVELQQSGGEINRNMKGNILRAAINPIASAKQNIELRGQHAKVQAHVTLPSIYVNVEQEPDAKATPQQPQKPQPPGDRFRIVRMQTKPDKRVVGNIKIAVYGKVSQEQKLVATTSQPLTGGWVKVTPVSPLAPGEYAVVEMLGDEGMNLYVWDFGVNPAAPVNPTAWKPEPAAATPDKPKELEKRQ